MKARLAFIVSALVLFSLAQAAENKNESRYLAQPLKGDYYMYGGTMSEMTPATRKDRKISFMFTGQLAKELFNEIGPDAKDACSTARDYRERNRGDLTCTWTEDHGYSCYFGLDVPTGKSIHGSIC